MKNIQLLVLDVDGTMTDGGVYYDDHGNETKKFSIKDGAALVLAHAAGLQVMICTGRECPAVARRAAELKVEHLHQNVKNKRDFLADFMLLNIPVSLFILFSIMVYSRSLSFHYF